MQETVTFYSDGLKLVGQFSSAQTVAAGEVAPTLICLHGYTGRKDVYLTAYVRELTAAGFHTLDFYHRGYGDSEGVRLRNKPWEQVEDIRSALIYVQQRSDVDADRIGVYGTSFGGSTAMAAAAVEERIACAASVGGPADVGRSWRSKRSYSDNMDFEDVLEVDRVNRVLTGESRRVPFGELIPSGRREQDSLTTMYKVDEKYPEGYPLENFDFATAFVPEHLVADISPRAVLFVHAERDTMVPVAESRSFYARAREPKKLVVIPGANHVDVYEPRNPEVFGVVVGHLTAFFREHLTG
jgi:uncharacterized protein